MLPPCIKAAVVLCLASASLALLMYAYTACKNLDFYSNNPVITVSGEGEILAKPDIGNFTFSVQAKGDDAAAAQEQSATAINAILAYLKDQGVDDKDIKTQNYNLSPNYRYEERICLNEGYCPPGERVIDGYQVSQSVSVKVRDLDNSGTLIAGVGELGATNISGLSFTIDDMDELQAEARELAIADAKAKAEVLAEDLGLKISKIVGFSEVGGGYPEMYQARSAVMAFDMAEEAKIEAELPTGENTIAQTVSITFEMK